MYIAVPCYVQAYPGRHGMGPTHPEHLIGTSLHKLQVGQTIDIKGPFGDFTYQPGQYKSVGASCFPKVSQHRHACCHTQPQELRASAVKQSRAGRPQAAQHALAGAACADHARICVSLQGCWQAAQVSQPWLAWSQPS